MRSSFFSTSKVSPANGVESSRKELSNGSPPATPPTSSSKQFRKSSLGRLIQREGRSTSFPDVTSSIELSVGGTSILSLATNNQQQHTLENREEDDSVNDLIRPGINRLSMKANSLDSFSMRGNVFLTGSDASGDARNVITTANTKPTNSNKRKDAFRNTLFFKPTAFNVDSSLQPEEIGSGEPGDVGSFINSKMIPAFEAVRNNSEDEPFHASSGKSQNRKWSVNLSTSDFTPMDQVDEDDDIEDDNISFTSSVGVSPATDAERWSRKRQQSESSVASSVSLSNATKATKYARKRIGQIVLPGMAKKEELSKVLHPLLFSALDFAALDVQEGDRIGSTGSCSIENLTTGVREGILWGSQEPNAVTEVVDGKTKIKSGTLLRLISLLTCADGMVDQEYLADFLKTYRYFVDASDVARILIFSYIEVTCAIMKSSASSVESHEGKKEKLNSKVSTKQKSGIQAQIESQVSEWQWTQLRTLNVFKKWIEYQPQDFSTNSELYELTNLFLDKFVKTDPKRALFAESLRVKLEEKIPQNFSPQRNSGIFIQTNYECKSEEESPISSKKSITSPVPIDTSGFSIPPAFDVLSHTRKDSSSSWASSFTESSVFSTIRRQNRSSGIFSASVSSTPNTTTPTLNKFSQVFSEIDPEPLAYQFTLLEQRMFQRVQPHEFFCQYWNDRAIKHVLSPNLVAVIQWFNRVSYGVATEIVREQKLKSRVMMLKRFIFTAHLCMTWNNFNTVFEIVAGLNLAPVTRLKKTWKNLPKKYWDVWNSLNTLISSEGSYRAYRNRLKNVTSKEIDKCPLLPYLGVTLKDLTFAEDGNPTYVPGDANNSINFVKFRLISSMLNSIMQFQNLRYNFETDDKMQKWLQEEWVVFDDVELYEHSKACEPREITSI